MTKTAMKPRQGRPKDASKREEIIAAATLLFMENGFELTSMEAVARKAGVSKLTIYSHFADKNDLFCAIMHYRCAHLGMPETFAPIAAISVEEALLHIASTAVAIIYHEDSLRLQRIIYAEAARHPAIVKIFYDAGPRRIKSAFAEMLREFDGQRKLSVPDPAHAAEQFFSLLKGEKLQQTLALLFPVPSAEELAAHARSTVKFFLDAYRPRATITSLYR